MNKQQMMESSSEEEFTPVAKTVVQETVTETAAAVETSEDTTKPELK